MYEDGPNLECSPSYSSNKWPGGYLALLALSLLIIVSGLQPNASVAANGDKRVVSQVVYLPALFDRYPPGLAGQVLFRGAPAAAIPLRLYFFNGANWSAIASTTTDSSGSYRFAGIAALAPGQKYYVRYGPNETNPDYVYSWYGPLISSYAFGDSVFTGTFDISDVPLLAPVSGATAGLPVTFTWQRRGLTGETYRVALLDPARDDYWFSDDLGDVGEFTAENLPPAIQSGRQYAWYVEVYQGPDSFGESFMLNDIRFVNASAQERSEGREAAQFVPVKKLEPPARSPIGKR